MTETEWIDAFGKILVFLASVVSAAIGYMYRRSTKNRKNITSQGKDIVEVQKDIIEVKDSIQERWSAISIALKNQLEEEIDGLNRRITELANALTEEQKKNEELVRQNIADREMYQKQLEEKEKQLQAQIEITNRLNQLIEDERVTATDLGTRYGQLEDGFREMKTQMMEQKIIIETYDRILARADLAKATPDELKNRETTELSVIKEN